MKKGIKKGSVLLLGGVLLMGLGMVLGQNTIANEKKVYIADENLRASIIEQLKWNPAIEKEEIIENELPTTSQMERLEQFSVDGSTSLEGIQTAKNITRVNMHKSELVDFRSISRLENLKKMFMYAGEADGEKIFDLSPFSELKNLEYLSLGYYIQVFDFSPLSSLKKLERLQVTGCGAIEFPAVYVSKTTKNFL